MNENVVVTNEYFNKLFRQSGGDVFDALLKKPFPPRISYWISRFIPNIQKAFKEYNDAQRLLLEKCTVIGKNGEPERDITGAVVWKDKEARETFTNEHEKLLSEKVDLGFKAIEVMFEELEKNGIMLSALEWDLAPFLKLKELKEE